MSRLTNWKWVLSVVAVIALTNFVKKRVPQIGMVLDA